MFDATIKNYSSNYENWYTEKIICTMISLLEILVILPSQEVSYFFVFFASDFMLQSSMD